MPRRSRARRPASPLVLWGGPHPTVLPEESLAYDCVDVIALGEAEETMRELVEQDGEPRGRGRALVQSARWREIVRNPPRPPIHDLGALPHPARDLVDMEAYARAWYSLTAASPELRGTSVIASRGCPYSCTYCQPTLDKLFGKQTAPPPGAARDRRTARAARAVSARRLYARRRHLYRAPWLGDRVCPDAAPRRGCDFKWGCNVRADLVVKGPHLLEEMARAGLVQINMGIESGSQRILDEVYNKGITVEQVREAAHDRQRPGAARGRLLYARRAERDARRGPAHDRVRRAPADRRGRVQHYHAAARHDALGARAKSMVGTEWQEFDYYRHSVYQSDQVLSARQLDLLQKVGLSAVLCLYAAPSLAHPDRRRALDRRSAQAVDANEALLSGAVSYGWLGCAALASSS